MNFGIVNKYYPPESGGGGIATYNVNLAHEMSSSGHQVVIVSATDQAKPYVEHDGLVTVYRIPKPRISAKIDQHLLILGKYMRTIRTLMYAYSLNRVLPRIVQKHNLEVLEYADYEAEAFFHDHKKLPPYGIRLHGPTFSIEPYYRGKEMPFNLKYLKMMEKKAIINADVITSPTQAFADDVWKEYNLNPSRITVIPHFYKVDDCAWVQQHQPKEDSVVLFVGRIEWKKGADIFAQTIPLVAQKWPKTRFIFVAWDRPQPDGTSTKQSLQKYLHEAGVLDKVSFLTAPELNGCIYSSLKPDICVVPSRYEAFSYPCLESMAHGIPVVASRVCGIPEVIEHEVTGLLFTVGDIDAFAHSLDRLLGDSELRQRMGKAGFLRANGEIFDSKNIVKQTISLYTNLLAGKKAG